MTIKPVLLASLCLCLSTSACTDDSANTSLLTGQWTECETARSTFTFGEDGSYGFDETCNGEGCSEDHVSGAFEVNDNIVFVDGEDEDGTPVSMEFSYHANDSHMVLGAAYPDGEHSGVVGTWNSQLRTESGAVVHGVASEIVLNADNTGSWARRSIAA